METTTYPTCTHFDYKLSLENQLKSSCATLQKLIDVQFYQTVEAYDDIIARYHKLIQNIATEMADLDESEFLQARQENAEQAEP